MWGFDSLEAMKTTLDVEKRAEKSKKQGRRPDSNTKAAAAPDRSAQKPKKRPIQPPLGNRPENGEESQARCDRGCVARVRTTLLVSDKVSECLHIVANEPSLGLYRLQEHVRRSVPALVSVKVRYHFDFDARARIAFVLPERGERREGESTRARLRCRIRNKVKSTWTTLCFRIFDLF